MKPTKEHREKLAEILEREFYATLKIGPAIWNRPVTTVVEGKWVHSIEPVPVRIMSLAEGYAMVRRKAAMPFAVSIKDISPAVSNPCEPFQNHSR
jgi:hypothetical protein